MHIRHAIPFSLLILLAAAAPAQAAPSYDGCTGTIPSVPAVISTPGTWCLKKDLSTSATSGNAIEIQANNVTIDCNGFKLGGLGGGAGTLAYGVRASSRLNATVRDCKIRGFNTGVYFSGATSAGHVIEDNLLEGNTTLGVFVNGSGTVVRRNRVFDTGGSSLNPGEAHALYLVGNVDAIDNNITGVTAADSAGLANASGILLASSGGSRLAGNQVRDILLVGDGTATGILLSSSTRADISDNFLVSAVGTGIACTDATSTAYRNHTSGFIVGIGLCNKSDNLELP